MSNVPNIPRAIGNKISTSLNGNINASTTSVVVSSASGMSTSGGYIIVDKGLSNEEIMYVESISGNTLTLATNGRGRCNTVAATHSTGAVVNDVIVDEHPNGMRTEFLAEHNDSGAHTGLAAAIVMSGAAASSSNKVADAAVIETGWLPAGETWTYASATTFTITGVDRTTKYYPCMKIKLTQTTAKYFIITKVAFSTDTTVTVYGGTDYTLANAAITSPLFSLNKAPAGFPMSPTKWSVTTTDTSSRSQVPPTATTWYNLGSVSITIPIGVWYVSYQVAVQTSDTNSAVADVQATLSTANNSESDVDFTTWTYGAFGSGIAANVVQTLNRTKCLELTSSTQYFLNTKTSTANIDSLNNRNDASKLIITATSAYL